MNFLTTNFTKTPISLQQEDSICSFVPEENKEYCAEMVGLVMAKGPVLGFDDPAQLIKQCGLCMISTSGLSEDEYQKQCGEPHVTYDDQPIGISCENLIDMLMDSMMQEEMMMEEEALAMEEKMMMEEEALAMGEEMAMPYIPADQMPEIGDYTLYGDTTMVPSDKVKELQCFDYTLEGKTMEEVVMEAGNVCLEYADDDDNFCFGFAVDTELQQYCLYDDTRRSQQAEMPGTHLYEY